MPLRLAPTGTTALANGGTGATTAAAARVALGVSTNAFVSDWGGGAIVANQTIVLARKAPFGFVIDSLDYEVGNAGGSFTVAAQINGTPVTGISAVAVSSSTSANAASSAAKTVAAGDKVTLVITSTSGSPTGANLQLNITK